MGVMDNIKKDAAKSGAAIGAANVAQLKSILDKMFYIDPSAKIIRDNAAVWGGVLSEVQKGGQYPEDFAGADVQFCVRRQVLAQYYLPCELANLSIKHMQRMWEYGALKWRTMLAAAGYTWAERNVLFLDKKTQISYAPLAVCEIPEYYGWDKAETGVIETRILFLLKQYGDTYWHLLGNPAKSPDIMRDTANLYMALHNVRMCVVISENRTTAEYKLERFDFTGVPEYIKRRVHYTTYATNRFLAKHKMPTRPRCAADDFNSYAICRNCRMREVCYKKCKPQQRPGVLDV